MPAPLAAAAAVGRVVSALADLPGAIKTLTNSFTAFVEAIDPYAVRAFDEAMRSLYATIGYALTPALRGFTTFVRELAGELFRPFTDLREVVASLARQTLGVVRPILTLFGVAMRNAVENLKRFMPVIDVVMATLEGLGNVASVAAQAIGPLLEGALAPFMDFRNLSGVADSVRDAFLGATLAVIRFSTAALSYLGFTDQARKYLEGLARGPDRGRAAALQNVQLGDTASVYRQRLLEAGRAGQGPDFNTQTLLWQKEIKRIAEELLTSVQAREAAEAEMIAAFNALARGASVPFNLGLPNPWPKRQENDPGGFQQQPGQGRGRVL